MAAKSGGWPSIPSGTSNHRIIASPAAADELLVPTCRGGLVVALKPGVNGTIKANSPFEYWRTAKGSPDVPSPLLYDGLAYLPRENGVLLCFDAKTGKQHYEEQPVRETIRVPHRRRRQDLSRLSRHRHYQRHQARPRIQAPRHQSPRRRILRSPAVSGGRLYLRGFRSLYAIQENAK